MIPPLRSARPAGRLAALLAMLALVATSQSGCGAFWDRLRESERGFAVDNARTYARRGRCDEALATLDHAQTRLEIGAFGEEATRMRARCYAELGRVAAAHAHRRLLDDFYGPGSDTRPDPDGSSVFRVPGATLDGLQSPPEGFPLASPTYNESARRSGIRGRVVIAFELSAQLRTSNIRVLEMPHPLLASWAIEAIERSPDREKRKKRSNNTTLFVPDGRFVTTYQFQP